MQVVVEMKSLPSVRVHLQQTLEVATIVSMGGGGS